MQKTVTLNGGNFQSLVLESGIPVLVDFYASWCGPCKAVAPTVDALAEELEGKAIVGKLNVDENPEVAQAFGIRSMPTFAVFVGGKMVERHVGTAPRSLLRDLTLNQVTA